MWVAKSPIFLAENNDSGQTVRMRRQGKVYITSTAIRPVEAGFYSDWLDRSSSNPGSFPAEARWDFVGSATAKSLLNQRFGHAVYLGVNAHANFNIMLNIDSDVADIYSRQAKE